MSEPKPHIDLTALNSAAKPRFGWPMRVLLFAILFNMVFRSLSVLIPCSEWQDNLEFEGFPARLATLAEIEKKAGDSSFPEARFADAMDSADSTWEFFRPWPGPKTRPHINSGWNVGQFVICWINSRFDFLESLLGINQEWPMFSPNVSRKRYVSRAELTFGDGSTRVIRQTADPEDLTNYSHWFEEKILDYELHVGENSYRASVGYCNLLAHRFAVNDRGSQLTKIRLFEVKYMFPPPEADPVKFLREQTGPPPSQVYPTFFEYDVATREGRMLSSP